LLVGRAATKRIEQTEKTEPEKTSKEEDPDTDEHPSPEGFSLEGPEQFEHPAVELVTLEVLVSYVLPLAIQDAEATA